MARKDAEIASLQQKLSEHLAGVLDDDGGGAEQTERGGMTVSTSTDQVAKLIHELELRVERMEQDHRPVCTATSRHDIIVI